VINPQKAIPISILLSLLVCAVCYIGLSTILTLIVPYYALDKSAPLPRAFDAIGYHVGTWFVAVGALASFLTWLVNLFPLYPLSAGISGWYPFFLFRLISSV